MNPSMSPRFQASCCAWKTFWISMRAFSFWARRDVDPTIAAIRQETAKLVTRIALTASNLAWPTELRLVTESQSERTLEEWVSGLARASLLSVEKMKAYQC